MQTVDVAYGVLEYFHHLELTGVYDKEQAIKQAQKVINRLRYRDSEYFWIIDETPTMVMHPKYTDLIGKDLSDISDANGMFLFKEFVRVAKDQGDGFVEHLFTQSTVVKVSRAAKFHMLNISSPGDGLSVVRSIRVRLRELSQA